MNVLILCIRSQLFNIRRQFRRPANFYFLIISALQCNLELSTTSWETTLIPLLFVLVLNGFKEGYDEIRRKASDEKVNKRQVEILKDDQFISDDWSTVIVGDVLKVNTNEEFPADLVFLSSSDPQGMVIKCEKPNNRMFQFEGSISLQGEGKLEVDETQILLRGTTLRHTEWILGAVVFTGMDTKLMKNMISGSHKVSTLELNNNTLVGIMLIILCLLCLSTAIASDIWTTEQANKWPFYIPIQNHWPEPKSGMSLILIQMLRFILLLNEFVPISMYVTLEIVKVVQCLYVNWDIHMFYHGANTPARARASGLTEELGQVEYILSDKTGTLTQNLMAFIKCSIGGEVYGKSSAESSNASNTNDSLEDTTKSVHNVGHDQILIDILNNTTSNPKTQICRAFFLHVALCHTVIPNYLFDDESEEVSYQSTSPDEAALVQGQGLEHFRILAVLEFTPERKRMSIICQEHKGRIKLYCKGADTVICRRLAKSQEALAEISQQQLEEFAKCGFRTLCMAERELSHEEFQNWALHFRQASLALDDRDEKLAACADNIEKDMVLLGVSAVEDKLQEGVPETVTLLAAAGIKLWVLTGDKLETAVSIGLSCNLLAESMHLFLLSESIAHVGSESSTMAIVIEGASVGIALEEPNRLVFLELCTYCQTVVCCRVSPLQKAQVTKLVKEEGKAVTLAIGDGANDVGMIKAAQIGVGISGKEGRAAEMASDYAIGQFRFLRRLLLVHGRWSYKRNRDLVGYSIYKNVVLSMAHYFFAFFSAYSAQNLYTNFFAITYNYIWTSMPTLLCAILDIDISARTCENNPQLYSETQMEKGPRFIRHMSEWIITSFWHSIIAFAFPYMAVLSTSKSGEIGGMWTLGLSIYTTTLAIVTIKLAIITPRFTLYHIISFILSLLVFIATIYFNSISPKLTIEWLNIKAQASFMFASPNLWLFMALAPIVACLPDTTFQVFFNRKSPKDFHIMQEMEHGWQNNVYNDEVPLPMSDDLLEKQKWDENTKTDQLEKRHNANMADYI
ncbi:hypothetical protein M758_3G253200 [Ceratodon purpureus]|nr:hypothetical protein M758_3G253200 [Ceratodon purpureus]